MTLALARFTAVAFTSDALAHCFVGARFFPATLATDDPRVANEMSLPTVAWSKNGGCAACLSVGSRARFLKADHRKFRRNISQGWTSILG